MADQKKIAEITECYRQIWKNGQDKKYDVIKVENVEFSKLAHFVPMEGTEYRKNQVRLLIIGRAVNGWADTNAKNEKDYEKEISNELTHKGFDWVIEENGTLYNKDGDNKGDYCLSSPFWNVSKRIYECLTNTEATGKWVENIAWTNLYKIAPTNTGNPYGEMIKIQKRECIDMLKAEIEYFEPTHILAMTGWQWWMENFKEIFEKLEEIKTEGKKYLEYVGRIGNIPIAVACRPEWKPKEEYVSDVMKAFM